MSALTGFTAGWGEILDAYLDIATNILSAKRRPMSAREIMREAYMLEILPDHLHGKTQHKTLHARIAEDILRRKKQSPFLRTAPGRFFLRSLVNQENTPEHYRYEFAAPVRADQLKNYNALYIRNDNFIKNSIINARNIYQETMLSYIPEKNQVEGLLKVISFCIVKNGVRVLSNSISQSYIPRRIYGRSFGLLTDLRDDDNSLFDTSRIGLNKAIMRTLHNTINVPEFILKDIESNNAFDVVGALWLTETSETARYLALITKIDLLDKYDPTIRFGPLSGLRWEARVSAPNDVDSFDPWSRFIINNTTRV